MTNNNLTEEQQKRIIEFDKGYKELVERTQIALQPKISPEGPVNTYVDLNQAEEQERVSQDEANTGGDN